VLDLQFMVQCVVKSTAKIFNIPNDSHEEEIYTLVLSTFVDGIRITLPNILKWCSLTEDIKLYF
jgi:hypothetical protein